MRRGTTAEWAAASPVVLAAGEPGWDSTLKGMKVGDGSAEWAALPWIDAKNRPDINADTLDGVHLDDIRLGQNILHNWDFRNPVNQRGVSGTISTPGYFYDRWYLDTGTVNIGAGYVALGSGAAICQKFESSLFGGRVCTLTILRGDGVYVSGTGTFPLADNSSDAIYFSDGSYASLIKWAGVYNLTFVAPAGTLSIQEMKLELGTVSTLHLDPPMDYGTELLKCQRYFLSLGTLYGIFGRAESSSAATLYINLSVAMRIIPTLVGATTLETSFIFTSTGPKPFTGFGTHTMRGNQFEIRATASGLTSLTAVTGYLYGNGAHIFLSADL